MINHVYIIVVILNHISINYLTVYSFFFLFLFFFIFIVKIRLHHTVLAGYYILIIILKTAYWWIRPITIRIWVPIFGSIAKAISSRWVRFTSFLWFFIKLFDFVIFGVVDSTLFLLLLTVHNQYNYCHYQATAACHNRNDVFQAQSLAFSSFYEHGFFDLTFGGGDVGLGYEVLLRDWVGFSSGFVRFRSVVLIRYLSIYCYSFCRFRHLTRIRTHIISTNSATLTLVCICPGHS